MMSIMLWLPTLIFEYDERGVVTVLGLLKNKSLERWVTIFLPARDCVVVWALLSQQ